MAALNYLLIPDEIDLRRTDHLGIEQHYLLGPFLTLTSCHVRITSATIILQDQSGRRCTRLIEKPQSVM